MRISVFGLGYVGVVTAACLAKEGHSILGVDIAAAKVDLVNAGRTPIVEEAIGELIEASVAAGRLRATTSVEEAVAGSDLAIVCVGTPSRPNGGLDHSHVARVMEMLGQVLATRRDPFVVVVRSTMVPGTMRNVVIPILERASGKPAGVDYEVLFHPEFLREGSSVQDFYEPPKIVVGERVPGTAKHVLELYDTRFVAPRVCCPLEVAETVKYCDNLFHAVKVTFANEVGMLCDALEIDAREVMSIFCQDRKLNISEKYLRPGFAFGGSCLPKDLRAFVALARERDVQIPMVEGVLHSNERQIERALRKIVDSEAHRVGFFGLSFKEGTDDLRESPYVELAERLIGKGRKVVVFDEKVEVSRLVGGNRSYVEQRLPHLASLLIPSAGGLKECDLIVLCHRPPEPLLESWATSGVEVFDLTGQLPREPRARRPRA